MASNPWDILARANAQTATLPERFMQARRQRLSDLYQQRQMDMKERQFALEQQQRDALSKVFQPQPKGGDPASTPAGSASASPQATISADGSTVIPAHGQPLPPRTDGLVINQDALNYLAGIDPSKAMEVRRYVYDGNKQALDEATKRGEAMASVAYSLSKLPAEQRAAELQNWSPYLVQHGFPAEAIGQADLSDAGLKRYYQQGTTLAQMVSQDNSDRAFSASEAQRELTNRRNAEADERARRAEGRAVAADKRSEVRFNERALDRAAIAGGSYSNLSTADLMARILGK